MMRVLVIAAATGDLGEATQLRPGDRAALHRGIELSGDSCQIRVPAGDRVAMTYAVAVGGFCETWSEESIQPADLVLIGPGAIELFGDELAGRLADQFSATPWFDVLSFEPRGESCRIVCEAGLGARSIVVATGPAVLVLSEQVERPPYVSQFRLNRADRLLPMSLATAQSGPAWQAVSPRPPRASRPLDANAEDRTDTAFGIATGSSSSNIRQVIAESPPVCAQILLRYLAQFGFVARSHPPAVALPEPGPSSPPPPVAAARPAMGGIGPTPAQRRGPRHAADSESRLRRRPRHSNRTLATSHPGPTAALQRGPRRQVDGKPPGRRGPFRLLTQTT